MHKCWVSQLLPGKQEPDRELRGCYRRLSTPPSFPYSLALTNSLIDEDDDVFLPMFPGPGMHHSKLLPSSSTSRLVSIPKRFWKARAKSQSRVASNNVCIWTPEGNCSWKTSTGHQVKLTSINLLMVTEIERLALQQIAMTKLKALNLGCKIELPKEDVTTHHKTKRRPRLLTKKSITTSFFEGKEKKERDLPSEGLVFGIPISQCLQNERLLRQRSSTLLHEVSQTPTTSRSEEDVSTGRIIGPAVDTISQTSASSLARTPESGSVESLPLMKQTFSELDRLDTGSADGWSQGSTGSLYTAGSQVPNVVNSCFKHIETFGLHTLGIFRVSGSKKRVRQVRDDFDSGKDVKLNQEHHPHDVAQLLKEYFRDLPEPLLSRELYAGFLITQKPRLPLSQIELLRLLIYLLPVCNRDTLWALLNFLTKISENAVDKMSSSGEVLTGNKMDSHNLATLFGPNLLRMTKTGKDYEFLVETLSRAQERCDVILVVKSLIDYNNQIFEIPADDLDAAYHRLLVDDPEAVDVLLRRRYYNSNEHDDSYGSLPGESPPIIDAEEEKQLRQILNKDRSRRKDKKSKGKSSSDSSRKSLTRPLTLAELSLTESVQTLEKAASENNSPVEKASSSDVTTSFTVVVPLSRSSRGPIIVPQLEISEASEDENNERRARSKAYGGRRHPTSPSYQVSDVSEEVTITITVPRRKAKHQEETKMQKTEGLQTPEQTDKSSLSKSASTSILSGITIGRSKDKKKAKNSETDSPEILKHNRFPFIGTSSPKPLRSRNIQSSDSVQFPQERWKRREIIASEHTEQT